MGDTLCTIKIFRTWTATDNRSCSFIDIYFSGFLFFLLSTPKDYKSFSHIMLHKFKKFGNNMYGENIPVHWCQKIHEW